MSKDHVSATIRFTRTDHERAHAAAKADGLPFTGWLRNLAMRRSLEIARSPGSMGEQLHERPEHGDRAFDRRNEP